MGLSASQARLLSLTARISDNELHSQTVANSKVRLADKSQEASKEYIRSLNASKLVYTTYDAKGQQTELALTPSLMYQFSSLKNQYGISNTAGQLLISQFDAMNFDTSNSIDEFIYKYGVSKVDNPKYVQALEAIYGENYAICYDSDAIPPGPVAGLLGTFNSGDYYQDITGLKNLLGDLPIKPPQASDYQNWLTDLQNVNLPPAQNDIVGIYYNLINHLNNPYAYPGDEPIAVECPEPPDFSALVTDYQNSACHASVGADNAGIWHMEHNLCHLIWTIAKDAEGNAIAEQCGLSVDDQGARINLTNSDGSIIIAPNTATIGDKNSAFSGHTPTTENIDKAKALLNAFEVGGVYNCVAELKQEIIDLYCDTVYYLMKNGYASSSYVTVTPNPSASGSPNAENATDLKTRWDDLYTNLGTLTEDVNQEYEEALEAYNQYITAHAEWENTWENIKDWKETALKLCQAYRDALANLPPQHIPDPEDPRTEWYTNLWHRLNGPSENKSADGTGGKYYKVLEDNLYENADWLQFALEHGVVALEQVVYVENADITTGLEHSKWQHTIYSSAVDIVTVEDEVAIQIAEAKYNKILKEIESKDKKYDMDIKKLDTEHNAMQQEYEALKSVIQKNAERSFKAFS